MKLSLIPEALDVLRKDQAVVDAAKSHDRAHFAIAIGLAISALAHLVGDLGYGQYVAFITPEMAQGLGLFVAGCAAGWGHWATDPSRGIFPAKDKPAAVDAPGPAAAAGSAAGAGAAVDGAPAAAGVRRASDVGPNDEPALHAGG